MKKLMKCAMVAVMVVSMTGCGKQAQTPKESGEVSTQIPSPFEICETIEAAEKIAGFDIVIPDKVPEGFSEKNISAIQDEMIEIIYNNGEDELRIRKGRGTDDVSGDYNQYDKTSKVDINNQSVTLKGNGDKISVAIWNDGEYSYSITVNIGDEGIDCNIITDLVKGIE